MVVHPCIRIFKRVPDMHVLDCKAQSRLDMPEVWHTLASIYLKPRIDTVPRI